MNQLRCLASNGITWKCTLSQPKPLNFFLIKTKKQITILESHDKKQLSLIGQQSCKMKQRESERTKETKQFHLEKLP